MTVITPLRQNFLHNLNQANNALKLELNDDQCQQLLDYLAGLLLWNQAYNLTATTSPNDAFVKHIMDCLAVLPAFDRLAKQLLTSGHFEQTSLLDIGTGAGLPAFIFAIARPTWQITALDSNGKKVRFMRQIASQLNITNITPLQARIENHASQYAMVTSRAFASLTDFVALGLPCTAAHGALLAMKGKAPNADELANAANTSNKASQMIPIIVPGLDSARCLVVLA